MTTVHRIYQERAYLSGGKHRRLDEAFRECARLYNAALEEWRTAYRQAGVGRTYYDQAKELTAIRAQDPYWGSVSIGVGVAFSEDWTVPAGRSSEGCGPARNPATRSSAPPGAGRRSR